jgi:hypothetical protein
MFHPNRRDAFKALGVLAASAAFGKPAPFVHGMTASTTSQPEPGENDMATITTKDGTTIFYKDWGPKDAQPIVFHHGWPLSCGYWSSFSTAIASMASSSRSLRRSHELRRRNRNESYRLS